MLGHLAFILFKLLGEIDFYDRRIAVERLKMKLK